ncbi:MAG TPA: DUF1761 domain-containing protein [Patescibacteria group bacterium]|nr:DUF1761 domain-containing protein [Patescibacteria group bacterium]
MSVEVNWLGVILAAVAAMVIGFVWYSRGVFGNTWMELAGLNDAKMKKGMAGPMVATVISVLLTSWTLAMLAFMANAFFKHSFMMDSVETALWVWLGISATTLVIHNSFEQKPWKLTAMNAANRLVSLLAMGFVIGLFKP